MGHYTGIAIKVKLKADLSPEQVAILEHITFNRPNANQENPTPDREHPMFKDERWWFALCSQNAYLAECEGMQPEQGERFKRLPDGRYLLRAAASTQSYALMMNLLPDWLAPLVDESEYGRICGEVRYEYTAPTRIGFSSEGFFKEEVQRTNNPYQRDLYIDMAE